MVFHRNTLVKDAESVDFEKLLSVKTEIADAPANQNRTQNVSDSMAFLAKELHDGVAQELWYLHTELESLVERVSGEQASLKDDVVRLRNVASEAYKEIRSTLNRLYAKEEESLDLVNELHGITEKFGSCVEMSVQFDSNLNDKGLTVDNDFGKQVCRLVQEALWNSWRHSMSNEVKVSVKHSRDRKGLVVSVMDNGCGFHTEDGAESGHYGLRNMQERAEAINGNLEVKSNLGEGTVVTLWLPL